MFVTSIKTPATLAVLLTAFAITPLANAVPMAPSPDAKIPVRILLDNVRPGPGPLYITIQARDDFMWRRVWAASSKRSRPVWSTSPT